MRRFEETLLYLLSRFLQYIRRAGVNILHKMGKFWLVRFQLCVIVFRDLRKKVRVDRLTIVTRQRQTLEKRQQAVQVRVRVQ